MPSCYELCIVGPRPETGWTSFLGMWIPREKRRSVFWAADLRFVLGAGSALDAWMDVTWGGVSGRLVVPQVRPERSARRTLQMLQNQPLFVLVFQRWTPRFDPVFPRILLLFVHSPEPFSQSAY
jgi:hypothetical protein